MLARAVQPLAAPDGDLREGYVPNVLYSCGAVVHDGVLFVPCGVGDVRVRVFAARLDAVLDAGPAPGGLASTIVAVDRGALTLLRAGDTIRAVIRATGTNQDGRTPTRSQPSAAAQEQLIRHVYAKAGLGFKSTRFVEAHGTGK